MEKKILHRDISLRNIILTDPAPPEGRSGLLIDLELSIEVGDDGQNKSTEARHMTGTLEYMALEILEGSAEAKTAGIAHTYRHDLESFFYVLLAACNRFAQRDGWRPECDLVTQWSSGPIMDMALKKYAHITAHHFEACVLAHFAPACEGAKGLARKLRECLFEPGVFAAQSGIYLGTPDSPDLLYDRMIGAFDEAIQSLG
jgi:serine/threonine protein kinase